MVDVYPIHYSKALLDTVPEDERTFHLMAGQLVNDLNIFTKLLAFSTNPVDGHEFLNRANTAIAMLMIKQLAGRLNEGWETIKDMFLPLHKKYQGSFNETTQNCLSQIKKYFSHSNLINQIRKQAGFHSDPELVKKGYALLPSSEPMVDFLSEIRWHCLYHSSEIVAVMGLCQLLPDLPWQKAIDTIAKETTDVANLMTDFILGYMQAFTEKYIEHTIRDINESKITLTDGPPMDSVIIPFFISPPVIRFQDDAEGYIEGNS